MHPVRERLHQQLLESPAGYEWCATLTEHIDSTIRRVYSELIGDGHSFSVVATGGYGRRQLSPFSDLDYVVIPAREETGEDKSVAQLFRRLYSELQDTLGFVVDSSYLPVADVPGMDPKTRTGLLDARLVAGSSRPLADLMQSFWDSFPVGDFVITKIRERERFMARSHETPLVASPDLKDGAGGIRCVHTAGWLAMALGQRAPRLHAEMETVLKVRNLAHVLSGKKVEVLSPGLQAKVADALEIAHPELMRQLLSALDRNHELYREAVGSLKEARYVLRPGVWAVHGEVRFESDVRASEAAIGIAHATNLELNVDLFSAPTHGPIDAEQAVLALSSGESTLRNLDRCGILSTLIPEMESVRYALGDDLTHEFTVFEHTLRCIRYLDQMAFEEGFYGELYRSCESLRLIAVALLFHDLGKPIDQETHAELGAQIAERVTRDWDMEPDRQEQIVWLVRHHLEMARIARTRDVLHPETAAEFAALVRTPERLQALTLLTVADIRAVSGSSWTQTQDAYLRELNLRTMEMLRQEGMPDLGAVRAQTLKSARFGPLAPEALAAHLDRLPNAYLLTTPADLIPRHHAMMEAVGASGQAEFAFVENRDLAATEITVCAPDAPGLLSRVLGVLYAFDLGLIGLRAFTSHDEPHLALDVFTVSFRGGPVPTATLQQVEAALRTHIPSQEGLDGFLENRGKHPHAEDPVHRASFTPGSPAILELRVRHGRGMAFRLSRRLMQLGLSIEGARFGQWAGQASASFYLTRSGGAPITEADVLPLIEGATG